MTRFTKIPKRSLTVLLIAMITGHATGQDSGIPDGNQPEASVESTDAEPENLSQWSHVTTLAVPKVPASDAPAAAGSGESPLIDFFVAPEMFEVSHQSLSDLRIYTTEGTAVPYAIRVLSPRVVDTTLASTEFNRSEPDEGERELTLELSQDDIEHNAVIVETTGSDFRRPVVILGSDDGKEWTKIAQGYAFQLTADGKSLASNSFTYPPSRYRYVRVRVTPDSQISADGQPTDQFEIETVSVRQSTQEPGQSVTTDGMLGVREPTRYLRTAGSRWIIDLGAKIPCESMEFEVKDDEFARDVLLEYETINALGQPTFQSVYLSEGTEWQRRSDEQKRPIRIAFQEVLSRRFRLTIQDYRNKPLTLLSAKASAPARQVILKVPANAGDSLKVLVGNPEAETANYDFSRNLPESLTEVPTRATLGTIETNPDYVPPAKALTERFPWMIYVALCSVSAVLGAVILNLSRAAIHLHDAGQK